MPPNLTNKTKQKTKTKNKNKTKKNKTKQKQKTKNKNKNKNKNKKTKTKQNKKNTMTYYWGNQSNKLTIPRYFCFGSSNSLDEQEMTYTFKLSVKTIIISYFIVNLLNQVFGM